MYIYPILRDFETSQKFTRKANANSTSESNWVSVYRVSEANKLE